MIAVLGGVGAAVAWALATLCSSRSSRQIEPACVVAWVMLVGFVITAPAAVLAGIPDHLNTGSAGWLVLSGAGNVGGLVVAYYALRIGNVTLVAPLVSTEGAIAAVIAILTGETLAPAVAATLVVIATGVCLSSVPRADHDGLPRSHVRAATLAMTAALTFGVSLYATGRAGSELPAQWVVLSARLIGTVALVLPLALAGRLRLTRRVLPLVLISGVCEVAGFYSYIAGARHGIAVAAVLSSQFAALAALGGYAIFGERLGRIQLVGVSTVLGGVALISVLRA
jgi:drug/metabolite transporter (DMT)-like permease